MKVGHLALVPCYVAVGLSLFIQNSSIQSIGKAVCPLCTMWSVGSPVSFPPKRGSGGVTKDKWKTIYSKQMAWDVQFIWTLFLEEVTAAVGFVLFPDSVKHSQRWIGQYCHRHLSPATEQEFLFERKHLQSSQVRRKNILVWPEEPAGKIWKVGF